MTTDALVRLRSRLWDTPARDLARAARALRSGGPQELIRATALAAKEARIYGHDLESRYRRWVEQVSPQLSRVPDSELFADVARAPRFLVVVWIPAGRPEEIEPLLRSLRQQPYPHWHLWLVGTEPIDDRTEERIYNRVPGEKRLHVAKRDPAREGDRSAVAWD